MAVEHSLHVCRVRSRQDITQFVWTKHLTQTLRVIGLYLMTFSEDYSDLNSYKDTSRNVIYGNTHHTHISLYIHYS